MLTAQHFFCFPAAVLLGCLVLTPLAFPLKAAAKNDASSPNSVCHAAAPSQIAHASNAELLNTSRQRARKKRSALSPFVRIGQWLIEDIPLCQDWINSIEADIPPLGNGCLATDPALQWAFPSQKDVSFGVIDSADMNNQKQEDNQWLVMQQPGSLSPSPYTTLSRNAFLPLKKTFTHNSWESPFDDETWFTLSGTFPDNEKTVTKPVLHSGPGQDETPFVYRYNMNRTTALIAGLGWIDDIADTTGMSQVVVQSAYSDQATPPLGAVNLTFGASYHAFTFTGGYIRAMDRKNNLVPFSENNDEVEPAAWNSELAYQTALLTRKTTLAVGYQKSSEPLSSYLPEERYTTSVLIMLHDTASFFLEYSKDRDTSTENGITKEDTYGITIKLGIHF